MLRSTWSLPVVFFVAIALNGCNFPARQQVPQVNPMQWQAEWREELQAGRKADRALAYLLTQGFECRLTRDEKGQVEQIVATQPNSVRDGTGGKQNWRITLGIEDERIQTTAIRPVETLR